jgi:dihydrodipicolinate synthase/N-acetylneuraminate lyase
VRGVLERFGLVPAAKAILRHMGLGDFRCRPPLVDLDDGQVRELVAELAG